MNGKELGERYGIVRVNGYWREKPGGVGPHRVRVHYYVRAHYRASPGAGPLGEP